MKRCLHLIVILIIFTSCDQVIFTEPQPKKVKELIEIPHILHGTYLDQDGDTMYVDQESFSYSSSEYGGLGNVFLSDSAVLKQYKDQYYYNASVVVMEERFWLSYIIYLRDGESGFDLYAMDPDDIVKLAKLQEVSSKIRDIEDGEQKYYLFDPKKKDYKKIISDTIFTKMISFERL